jgi:aspartyl-tRNA synthetase
MEGCMRDVWRRVMNVEFPEAFPRLTHSEALARYGSDKPDLRFGLELADVLDRFRTSDFSLFRTLADGEGNRIIALRYPGGASLSRRDFDALTETAKTLGAKGLVHLSLGADGARGPVAKFVDETTLASLRAATEAVDGDALLLVGDEGSVAADVAGRLRLEIGERLGLRDPKAFAFCWIVGFPLFERDPDTTEITFAHHPFTAPAPGQEVLFDTDPLAMRAQHYDLVLNGYELGSGSIRNHQVEIQRKIFERLGLSDAEISDRFGFFMEALQYGAPPHGGMALGLDRIAMIACAETSIREVIAFPKNQAARDLMMDAPSPVPKEQLDELGLISTVKPPAQT